MLDLAHYEALRQAPASPVVMYQRWRELTFLHFPCDPAEVQATLPDGLTVDTFPAPDGREAAWVGLVPFRMEAVRPRLLPSVPGLSAFPETNVRTYVHREGREPGVWFYSLDAANAPACALARLTFGLPYHHAAMTVDGAPIRYVSRRLSDGSGHEIDVTPGADLGPATPGTLEYFLIERYRLYSMLRGRLVTGRVHHEPYPLRGVSAVGVRETLVAAAGLRPRPFVHHLFSPGVDVRIFAPSAFQGNLGPLNRERRRLT
ncbi:MAG: YqjF family protein [Fimbriimonas sp.]